MSSKSPLASHFIFDLIRKPLHSLLILLLLFSPAQSYAAVPRGGAESGTRPLGGAEPLPISLPGSAPSTDPAAATPGSAPGSGSEGTATSALQSPETAASGLDPDIEALISEEENEERREAQAATMESDQGTGDAVGSPGSLRESLAAPPEVDLSTGSARLTVPILIPPGRRGATPDLKLVYSSSGGDSPFGYGWNLPIGSISRNTKHGVPGCPLNETDTKADFVISLNGSALELKRLHAGSTGTHIYRPRISESSLEVSAHTRRNEWDAYDRAGNHYYFGQVASARLHNGVDKFYNTSYNAATGANCQFTTMWMLTRFVDTNGNEIKYHYYKDVNTQNVIYPYYIDYGGNGGSASLREAPFRILFDHSISLINRDRGTPLDNPKISPWTRDPRSISYARGVLERRYYVVSRIRVFYRDRPGAGHKLIRQYRLDYLDDPYTGRNLLQRVRTLDPAGATLVPPQTFEYASSKLDFAPEVTVPGPRASDDRPHLSFNTRGKRQTRALHDINGDGYLDLIDSDENGWVRLGTANGITGPTFNRSGFNPKNKLAVTDIVQPKREPVREARGRSLFLDMSGDGIPDRLWTKDGKWLLSRGVCTTPTKCGDGPATIDLGAPAPYLHLGWVHGDNRPTFRRLLDWNADGLPDYVDAAPPWMPPTPPPPQWHVHLNTGSGFQRLPLPGPLGPSSAIESIYARHSPHYSSRVTMDVNGDRLPDHLYSREDCVTFDASGNVARSYPGYDCPGAVKKYSIDRSKVTLARVVHVDLNSGRGFHHRVIWYLPALQDGSNWNRGLRRERSGKGVIQDLRDINGDGLPDFVSIAGGVWRVTYNQGGVIDVSQNPTVNLSGGDWISQFSRSSSDRTTTGLDFFDMDGDALPELVNAWNMASWKVRKLRAPGGAPLIRPGLLVKAHNGLGAVAELQYKPSTRYDNTDTTGAPRLPGIHWVVSALRQGDGLCDPGTADVFDPGRNPCSGIGHDLITRYHYQGGMFDAASREFRGFRMVMATDAAGNHRKLYFSQSDTTRGKMLREEQWIGNRLLAKTSYVWRTRQSVGRTQVYMAEQKQEEMDLDHGPYSRCLLNRGTPPDDHGRVGTTCSLSCKGAPATPGSCASPTKGQVDTVTTWANPLKNSWVRERPSHVLTRYVNAKGALETLEEKWFYYDGTGADGLPSGQVKQGNVKRVVSKLDRSFAGSVVNPTIRNEYGPYGNLTATVDPNGRRTESDYRGSPFQLYPRIARNPLGHTVTTVTDLRYGKPTSVTDPNGQITHYRYDALGRTLCAAGPLDNIAGCGNTTAPFTRSSELRYVYGNPAASGFQAKLSYVETRVREPWADGNAASHTAADYVATRQYSDALGRGRFQMGERVIGASGGSKQWVVEGQSHYNSMGFVAKTYVPYVLRAGSQVAELPGVAATLYDYRLNGGADWDPLGRPFRVTPPDKHPITTYYGAQRKAVYYAAPGRTSAAAPRAEDPIAATAETVPEDSSGGKPRPQRGAQRVEDPPSQRSARREDPPSAQQAALPKRRPTAHGDVAVSHASSPDVLALQFRNGERGTQGASAPLHRTGGRSLEARGDVSGASLRGLPEFQHRDRPRGLRRAVAAAAAQLRRLDDQLARLAFLGGHERQPAVADPDVLRPAVNLVGGVIPGLAEAAAKAEAERKARERAERERLARERAAREARERAAREARERAAREARERAAREARARVTRQEAALRGTGTSNNGVVTHEDDFGRVVYRVDLDAGDNQKLWFTYAYDGLGRMLSTFVSNNGKTKITTTYDTLGRPVQIADPNLGYGPGPGIVRLGYDPAGNLIYRDTPVARERVQWCYDALNRPTARFLKSDGDAYVASLCSNTAQAETRYTYDAATAGPYAKGRLSRVDDQAGYATTVYDQRGRVLRQTRSSPGPGGPRGGTLTLSYAFDLADHLTSLTYPDGEIVRYRYNRVGQVVSMAGTGTYLKDLQYDFQGRPDLIVHGNGTTAQPVVDDLSYYGAAENFRLRETHSKKGTTSYYRSSYAYEERGKVSRITDHLRSTGPLASTHSYNYDGLGRLVKTDWLANGRTTDAYDAAYTFDRSGNMTQKGSLRGALRFTHHAARPHQITSYGARGTEHAVLYDSGGRMASRVVKTGATAATAKSESYFYDAVDRMQMAVVHTGTGVYRTGAAQDSITRYFYDSGGQRVRSQVTKGTTTSTTHHFFAEVEVRDGETTKYYFAAGLRIAGRIATPSAAATAGSLLAGTPFRGLELSPWTAGALALLLLLLLLSPGLRGASRWRLLLVPTRALATAILFWLALLPPGLAKAALPGNVTLWHYHLDHLGTTHSITDASGNLYRQTRTTAYGEIRGRYDGSGNIVAAEAQLRHEFTGYESEAESGLQYAGARYYLPELGVFTSHDPAEQFASPYAYSGGDPLNGTDPDGTVFGVHGGPFGESVGQRSMLPGTVTYYDTQTMFGPHLLRTFQDPIAQSPIAPVQGLSMPRPDRGLSGLDQFQLLLDATSVGLDVSGAGAFFSALPDLANAGISAARGDFTGAGLSAAGAVPILGAPANAARMARTADRVADAVDPARAGQLLLGPGSDVPNAGGRIRSFVTESDQIYYRVFSGDARIGGFLTAVPPGSSAFAREALALPTTNSAKFIQNVFVPAGTRLQRSRVLSIRQANGLFQVRRGGAEQFQLLNRLAPGNFGPGVPLQ